MPDEDWWRALWPDPAVVLSRLADFTDRDVIDLCCGDGLFTLPLARMARRVAAIDLDRTMIARLRDAAAVARLDNVASIDGDALDVADLVDWPADAVLLANTLHGVPDKAALGRAIAAALRPNGRLVVINWNVLPRVRTIVLGAPRGPVDHLRMRPDEVIDALTPARFVADRLVELPPFHYGLVLSRATA